MVEQPDRIRLSGAQVTLMREALTGAPPSVTDAAETIGRGEVVSDSDADTVVNALTAAMLGEEGYDGDELTARGREIDDIIGVAQQMSQTFYD
jgi:hypothetical protein